MNPQKLENTEVLYYTHHESYYTQTQTITFSTAPYPTSVTSKAVDKSRVHSSRAITLGFGSVFGTLDKNGLFAYVVPELEELQPHPVFISTSRW